LIKFSCKTNWKHYYPIINMWQVYTRPTSASDFFSENSSESLWSTGGKI
jgi:hypothetical protein